MSRHHKSYSHGCTSGNSKFIHTYYKIAKKKRGGVLGNIILIVTAIVTVIVTVIVIVIVVLIVIMIFIEEDI